MAVTPSKAPVVLRQQRAALDLVRRFMEARKPIAAISSPRASPSDLPAFVREIMMLIRS